MTNINTNNQDGYSAVAPHSHPFNHSYDKSQVPNTTRIHQHLEPALNADGQPLPSPEEPIVLTRNEEIAEKEARRAYNIAQDRAREQANAEDENASDQPNAQVLTQMTANNEDLVNQQRGLGTSERAPNDPGAKGEPKGEPVSITKPRGRGRVAAKDKDEAKASDSTPGTTNVATDAQKDKAEALTTPPDETAQMANRVAMHELQHENERAVLPQFQGSPPDLKKAAERDEDVAEDEDEE